MYRLIALLLVTVPSIASADFQVNCTTGRVSKPLTSFTASGLPSNRLVSDVSYFDGAGVQRSFQSFEVAQYRFAPAAFHYVTDDFGGNKVISLDVWKSTKGWNGALVEQDQTGAVIRRVAANCKVTQI